jgi:hypothetical protein
MSQQDLYERVLAVPALTGITARVNAVVNGPTVDLGVFGNDFRTALFVISAGTITDGSHAFKVQESVDGTVWTDAAAAQVQNSGLSLTSANSNSAAAIGYVAGDPRYIRLVATITGATTGGVYTAVAVLGEGSFTPVHRS